MRLLFRKRFRFGSAFLSLTMVFVAAPARRAAGQSATTSPAEPAAAQGTAEEHLGRGYEALKDDRYEIAVSEFRAALELDPKLVLRARFPLAVALFELHQPQEARREFEAVRKVAGDHPNVMYYLGRLDVMEEKFDDAIRELSKAEEKPPFPDTDYYLGYAYFRKGKDAPAEKWLRRAVERNPKDAAALYQLGLLYRETGREDEAKKTLARSEEIRRGEAEDSQMRIECNEKLDKAPLADAQKVCEKLYDPNDARKLSLLGTIYGRHGDFEAALKPLQHAAELSPGNPQMQYNLAYDYYQLKRFQEAHDTLAPAIKTWPDLFQLNALYGVILLRLGDEPFAYKILSREHSLNPKDAGTGDALFLTLMELARQTRSGKKYAESLDYLKQAAQLRPADPAPHRSMAEIYQLTGASSRAEAERREAERLASSQSSHHDPNR